MTLNGPSPPDYLITENVNTTTVERFNHEDGYWETWDRIGDLGWQYIRSDTSGRILKLIGPNGTELTPPCKDNAPRIVHTDN